MTRIAVLVGSLREDSFNKQLAKAIETLAPGDATFETADLNLPLFSQDLEADFPAKAKELKDLIERSDGVLFVTPEYNRSFSGVLKNGIDWASRPWGQNSFNGKPVAIVGASLGALGTTQAQAALRNVLVYLNTEIMGQPEVYFNATTGLNQDGSVADDAKGFLTDFANAFVAFVEKHKN
ncbi:NADPH-dependent FMN reductase [Bifidobacterium aquikefiricola]|uniref:NAD(P)H-dependent oxidoreductase n=1 Tax=Bifidobacterium aquikefiricola TaxID=3059038 RepID=A0AB39U628_9BIFI